MIIIQVKKSVLETIFEDHINKIKNLKIESEWKAEEVERIVLQIKEALENFH